MVKSKIRFIKLKKGKLPSKKVAKEYARLRKMGASPKLASMLARVRLKKKIKRK